MDNKISEELDFKKKMCHSSHYRMSKITPREGSSPITITTAGGQESNLEVPVRASNYSRSILSYTYAPPAIANNSNKCYVDNLSTIRQLQFQARTGVYVVDVNEVGNYTKIVWKPETKLDEFLSLENHDNGSGAGSLLQKCNVGAVPQLSFDDTVVAGQFASAFDAAADGDPTDAELKAEFDIVRASLDNLVLPPATSSRRHNDTLLANGTGNYSPINVPFNEPKYFSGGAINTADPVINVKIPLGMIYNTLLSLDKTIMFPEIMNLRIVWNATPKIYYYNNDAKSTGGGTLAVAGGNITVSNLKLFLAVETREDVINSLRQKISSPEGMSILMPYVHSYKTNLTSTSQNVVLKFDRGHGQRLQKIYHSLFNNTESKNTAYDNDNRSDAKLLSFHTTLDGQRLQEFDVDTSVYEDYMLLKDKLKGSVLMNSDIYQYNWFWCDDFTNNRPLWDKDPNEMCGLSLDQERRWEIDATTANANHNHYSFIVVQRELRIKSNSIELS